MTDVWESNVYHVGIAKCCSENEIDVYWMEIRVMLVVPLLNSSICYFSFTINSSVIVCE